MTENALCLRDDSHCYVVEGQGGPAFTVLQSRLTLEDAEKRLDLAGDFEAFPLATASLGLKDLLRRGDMAMGFNGCHVVLVPEGCSCTPGPLGQPKVSCDFAIPTFPEMPVLPGTGRIVPLGLTQASTTPAPDGGRTRDRFGLCGAPAPKGCYRAGDNFRCGNVIRQLP